MAINSYEKNGKTLWKAYVNLRSRVNPTVRVQRRRLDLKSEAAAITEEKKLIKLVTEELLKQEGRGLNWGEVVERWELEMRQSGLENYSELTFTDYISMIQRLTKDWLKRPANLITKVDFKEILKSMEISEYSANYQRKVKASIKHVFTWAIEERIIQGIEESPTEGVNVTKEREEKLPEVLNLDQIRRLLFEAKRLDHPWYPVWAMALLTGMRNGELHALLWSDVDIENGIIRCTKSYNTRLRKVKSTKVGRWRNVPISSELRQLLSELKLSAGSREHVLPRFWQWDQGSQAQVLRTFCLGVGLPSIRFHALRACFATQLMGHNIAPIRVMKICGWQDLKTMERYVRLAGVDEKGATECLQVLASDAEVMGKVVQLFKPESNDAPA